MYKRPTSGDTDEDILRLQQQFQQQHSLNKIKLAATVISEKQEDDAIEGENRESEIQNQLANTFEAVPLHGGLKIVEKVSLSGAPRPINFNQNLGFPKPKRRDVGGESSRGSIFANQFKRLKKNETTSSGVKGALPGHSFVVTGTEKDDIHLENVAKLQSMSESEILEEKETLLATTDPAIIAFLRSRRKEIKIEEHRTPTIKKQNEAADKMDIAEINSAAEILNNPLSDTWLNFKTVETTKLAWMREIEQPKIEKSRSYEARFDFEGWLLPFTEPEITEKSRSLYHHGDEAGRPGYTLQELFQLSRSNVNQQKIVALNTIANILALNSTGVYDDVIELPIEQIFFVLRFCLDDNSAGILNASVKAIRNLFFNRIDETCLDCLLGFGAGQVQPTLSIDNEPDDDRVNDQQLAEMNLVKCLIRTEILVRLRYIINTVQPTVETIVCCLEILIRLSRDSQLTVTKLYNCDSLISGIIKQFVGTKNALPQAVKLLRILSARNLTIARDFVQKYQIMDCLLFHLSHQQFCQNSSGLKLQTESLHFWILLTNYNLVPDWFRKALPVITDLLSFHLKNTDLATTYIKQSHVAAILLLIATNGTEAVSPIVKQCTQKWCHQFMTQELNCGRLQIPSALFYTNPGSDLVTTILNSNSFKKITLTILTSSVLLNNYKVQESSSNLKMVEAVAWYSSEHVVPIWKSDSCFPFLNALSKYIERSEDKNLKFLFLSHSTIVAYCDSLRQLKQFHLTQNWFTRVESEFLMDLFKIAIDVQDRIQDTRPFFELAVKSLNIFGEDQQMNIKYIMERIIFNKNFYPSDVLLKNLNLGTTDLDNLDEILRVYSQVLGLKPNINSFSIAQNNVIPVDWIYTPIVALYSSEPQKKMSEPEQIFRIRHCLQWILIYETYFPELAKAINATDRFCRITCVFVASDSLFLTNDIHNFLEKCFKNIIESEKEIDFERPIEGLSNFQDFFTQLLDQYQGVSYGDILFGNFILLVLVQRHSVKWRKILWSEYLGVVEIFNVSEEQSICPLASFLEPPEQDLSLLKCYRRAICNGSVRKHSILYKIAKHHIDKFVERGKIKK